MPFHAANGIRYFTFEGFKHPAIVHAIFTRQGGVSPKPWDSLNVGGFLGDDNQNAKENRISAFSALGRDPDSVYDVWQVHSADVIVTDQPRPENTSHLKADAILTDNPAVTLFMRFADCVPVLFFDPAQKVVGIAHAGWQGTVKKIVRHTVAAMTANFGTNPADIIAGIGPSIGAHHYEVGEDVILAAQKAFNSKASRFLLEENRKVKFDLWAANQYLLAQAGVSQVEVSGLCTACHPADWFSHRGEKGQTGRFGSLIGLNE